MYDKKSLLHKAGLAVGLATFLVSNAQASPFQAETLKTGYGNTEPCEATVFGGSSDSPATPHSSGPVTPHSYDTSLEGEAGHSNAPVVASQEDHMGDYSTEPLSDMGATSTTNPPPDSDKPVDGSCGMSGTGQ